MGDSAKLSDSGPGSYRFIDHRRYLDALLEALDVHERVTFVLHDWGSALGFDWANRHREAVKGITYMEAIVRPQSWDHWDRMGPGLRPLLQALRSEAGETMILRDNVFVEQLLPQAVLRPLSVEEMAEYRRPFAEAGEGRRPTLTWPREIPVDGEPADVAAIVAAYAGWLATSSVPKLFVKGEPGAILAVDTNLDFVRGWPVQAEVRVAGRISSRRIRRTRSGVPSPTGWGRWADGAMVGNDGVATYGRLRDLGARGRFMTEGPSVRRRTIIRSGEEGDARLVRFGYTRVHALLQREGFEVNRKRVYGIYGAASLTVERRTPQAPSVAPMPTGRGDAPDERWSMDFVHDYLGDGRKLRTFELLLGQPASRSNESPCRRAPAA